MEHNKFIIRQNIREAIYEIESMIHEETEYEKRKTQEHVLEILKQIRSLLYD